MEPLGAGAEDVPSIWPDLRTCLGQQSSSAWAGHGAELGGLGPWLVPGKVAYGVGASLREMSPDQTLTLETSLGPVSTPTFGFDSVIEKPSRNRALQQ